MTRLAVVGQDPCFGGGARAMLDAFLAAARDLGRDPELLFVPHPGVRPGLRASPLDRVEALRLLRGSRRLVPRLAQARPTWVVATLATHGLAARRAGRPYACWVSASVAAENRARARGLPPLRRLALHGNEPLLRRLEREVLRGARQVYATSPASAAEAAAAAELEPDRIGILPIPVDVEALVPEPDDRWAGRLEAPMLTFVGRGDDPRKNVALALEALPLLRRRIPGARLRLVGPRQPPARDGVEVLGEVASLGETLAQSSLLLLPSRQEGFGIVAAEALAAGVPVVSTPSGGPEELLRASGGGVVTSGWEAAELAAAAAELLLDRPRLLEARRRGREYVVREHSPQALAAALEPALARLERDA
jgi:glycosyltransferase involved in cell wall biosynthesis